MADKDRSTETLEIMGYTLRKSEKPKMYELARKNPEDLKETITNILKQEGWGKDAVGSVLAILESDCK